MGGVLTEVMAGSYEGARKSCASTTREWCSAAEDNLGGAMKAKFLALALAFATPFAVQAQSWEPTKNVEFIIPAGTGGGADQMARAIQGIVAKHGLMKQSILPINKSGGAGAEGFLDVKNAKGDPHKIIITLSNLFTTPLATGVPFNWRDLTPVQMLALDNFVLWVNAKTPYNNAKEYIEAAKKAGPGKMKMGGTGAKQEDQIITVAFEQKRMPYKEKVTDKMAWSDIPTCKEAGLDVDYLMLRGIFMPPGVKPEHVRYYVELFKKVAATPEWKKLMEEGAFNTTMLSGKQYADWVAKEEARHVQLMKAAGFIAGK